MNTTQIAATAQEMAGEVGKAILGKQQTIDAAIIALFANGHILLEDIPGVGKTTLAKALAKVTGGSFRRVQFTPDLLPSDVTGCSMFNQKTSEFEFRPGPIFSNIVLADEINRATPKTQSSLLEAMEERQVTSDGTLYRLPAPFLVIATQNNIEMTGTYPLPEAQMDRFLARLSLGYPDRDSEVSILSTQQTARPVDALKTIVSPEDLCAIQLAVREVFVHESVREYIVDVVRETRQESALLLGSSPRGSLLLMRAAQAKAAMAGRDLVLPDDAKNMAEMVLAHRLISRSEIRGRDDAAGRIIRGIIDRVPVPVR